MNSTCYSKRYNESITRALEWSGIAYQGGSTDTYEHGDVG